MPQITRDLNVLARCGDQYRNTHLRPLQLTATQAPYLLHICARPGMSQDELAKRLHVNPSNATRQLTRLEQLGLVERRPDPNDRRLLTAHPTQQARTLCPQIRRINAQWQAYLTQGMTEEEEALLETLLERVRQRATAWRPAEDRA